MKLKFESKKFDIPPLQKVADVLNIGLKQNYKDVEIPSLFALLIHSINTIFNIFYYLEYKSKEKQLYTNQDK